MSIDTEAGPLSPEKLPVCYEPAGCEICHCRCGWINTDGLTEMPIILCDECAALVSQGRMGAP